MAGNSGRRTDSDLGRHEEMSGLIFGRLVPAYVAVGAVFLASVPVYGFLPFILLLVEAVKMFIAHQVAQSGYHPTRVYLFAQYTSPVFLAGGVFLTGGISSPFLVIAAVHGALFPLLFNRQHDRASLVFLILTMGVAAFGPAQSTEFINELRFGALVATFISLRIIAAVVVKSDVQHRADATFDKLTGLENRRAFDRQLDKLTEASNPAALIICDVDRFKEVNDQHGHATGDRVLIEIAEELRDAFRRSDTAYRIGGEEFAFIAEGVTIELAMAMAESLRERIAVTYPGGIDISMSFGVAMLVPHELGSAWFQRSDEALFKAKRGGRNRVEAASF